MKVDIEKHLKAIQWHHPLFKVKKSEGLEQHENTTMCI